MKPPILKLVEEYAAACVDLSWYGSYDAEGQREVVEAHRKARKELYEALGLADFLPRERRRAKA